MHRRGIGISALGILLIFGIWNAALEHWEPPKIGVTNATEVDTLLTHAEAYEDFTVTFVSRIRTIETNPNNTTFTFAGVKGVLSAFVTHPLAGYKVGDILAIKGTSYVISRGYILVDAIHQINYNSVLGFSIIGGVLFVYYFFKVYMIDSMLSLKRRD